MNVKKRLANMLGICETKNPIRIEDHILVQDIQKINTKYPIKFELGINTLMIDDAERGLDYKLFLYTNENQKKDEHYKFRLLITDNNIDPYEKILNHQYAQSAILAIILTNKFLKRKIIDKIDLKIGSGIMGDAKNMQKLEDMLTTKYFLENILAPKTYVHGGISEIYALKSDDLKSNIILIP